MKIIFYKIAFVGSLLGVLISCGEKRTTGNAKKEMAIESAVVKAYSCPMHPQVKSDTAGNCPLCGMKLELIKAPGKEKEVSLNTLLKPANQQVIASMPMVHMTARKEDIEMESYGFITYDNRYSGSVSANVNGRIEKLYVKYRYQKISRGQRIMDIYSPELMTAQENLLFVLKNDKDNEALTIGAKQKLLLLGMSEEQVQHVIQSGRANSNVTIYSHYTGHIHESNGGIVANAKEILVTTEELQVKEGAYVQKGENIFSIYDPSRAWAVLNTFGGQASLIAVGNKVRITPETAPQNDFRAAISYIEPFYREGSKTLSARVYFDNSQLQLPIGSQVKATVFAGARSANWLPQEAVLSLGFDKVVFVRNGESFEVRKIATGIINRHLIQVLNGLGENEAVVANAQYLVDSESFIKTNK